MSSFEVVAEGFGLAEAPAWDGESLLFSDVIFGGVKRIGADGRVEEVLAKRRGIGGIVMHADGGFVASGRDLLRVRPDGEQVVVLDRLPGFTGYNDIGTLGDGTLMAGALRFNPMQGETPEPGAIVHVLPDGGHETTELPIVTWPNGIACAPDGETFYVADFTDGRIWRDAHELWARSPSEDADGMAVDIEGGVWVALGGGAAIARFVDGEDEPERVIEVPGADFVSSVCFGGPVLDDLYVTTRTAVLKTRVDVSGLPVPPARV